MARILPAEREAAERVRILAALEQILPGIAGNPYVPHWPHPPQARFLALHHGRRTDKVFEALYGGAAGGGKLLYTGEMIPTPNGFLPLSEIHPGDTIFGLDGSMVTVLAESDTVVAPSYRLTFDDGSELIANDEHKWLTFTAGEFNAMAKRTPEARQARRDSRASRVSGNKSQRFTDSLIQRNKLRSFATLPPPTGSVRTTAEIVATLRRGGRANHAIPVAQPIDMPHRELPLDPYILGVWLGDGTTANGSVTTMDPEILAALESAGFPITNTQRKPNNKAATHRSAALHKRLRAMGLLGQKRIPHEYLWASIEQRTALLQGLMDTDGYVCKQDGGCEFTSTNKGLADGLAYLLRSLGHKAAMREGVAMLHGRAIGPKWRISFQARLMPFRLPRHVAAVKLATSPRTRFRYIVNAERLEPMPMKCIRVSSSDHLYLAGEHFIATHNSDALLMAAAQHVDRPDFSALILRRSFADLALPGAIMDRALAWWKPRGVHWSGDTKTFRFPSGATVSFGYLQDPHDHLRYQGAEFQLTCWDELTQFPVESQYSYVGISRVRRKAGSTIPLRTLSASNPGGPGHEWVKARFIGDPAAGTRARHPYVPARIADNPSMDREAYEEGLQDLHPTVRAQLLAGDWGARDPGDYFRAAWFGPLLDPSEVWPASDCVRIRWWDLAASEKADAARTAGVRMARHRAGVRAVEHAIAFQMTPGARDDRIVQIAKADGHGVIVGLEIEGGSGGPAQFESMSKRLRAAGFKVVGARPRVGGPDPSEREKVILLRTPSTVKGKEGRADPVASCLERGYQRRGEGPDTGGPSWAADARRSVPEQRDGIRLFAGRWTQPYLDEIEGFPDGARCDLVDATSGAWAWLEAHPFGGQVPAGAAPPRRRNPDDVHPEERDEIEQQAADAARYRQR